MHISQSSLWIFVAFSLGFEIYSAWKSNTEFDSSIASILPHTRFVPQFKHYKGVDIAMGDTESLSTYPHYWKYYFVPNLLIGNINRSDQLTQGWTCHQAKFRHSDL